MFGHFNIAALTTETQDQRLKHFYTSSHEKLSPNRRNHSLDTQIITAPDINRNLGRLVAKQSIVKTPADGTLYVNTDALLRRRELHSLI